MELLPINDQARVDEFRDLVPMQYRKGLTLLEKSEQPGKQDYYCMEIKLGLLTVGQIILKLIPFKSCRKTVKSDATNRYYIHIVYVQLIEHTISKSIISDLLIHLQTIHHFFSKLTIQYIQANFLSGKLYDSICKVLLENNWELTSHFSIVRYDPFLDNEVWLQKYMSYQKVYTRIVNQGKYKIISFSQLSRDQYNSLQNVKAPSWALPFNESLTSSKSSEHSYAAFSNEIPVAWVIADSYQEGSLYLETSWFQTIHTSPIIIYAIFYLIFSKYFGLYGPKGKKFFSFRHLIENNSMNRLQHALKPFLSKKSECICYKYELLC